MIAKEVLVNKMNNQQVSLLRLIIKTKFKIVSINLYLLQSIKTL